MVQEYMHGHATLTGPSAVCTRDTIPSEEFLDHNRHKFTFDYSDERLSDVPNRCSTCQPPVAEPCLTVSMNNSVKRSLSMNPEPEKNWGVTSTTRTKELIHKLGPHSVQTYPIGCTEFRKATRQTSCVFTRSVESLQTQTVQKTDTKIHRTNCVKSTRQEIHQLTRKLTHKAMQESSVTSNCIKASTPWLTEFASPISLNSDLVCGKESGSDNYPLESICDFQVGSKESRLSPRNDIREIVSIEPHHDLSNPVKIYNGFSCSSAFSIQLWLLCDTTSENVIMNVANTFNTEETDGWELIAISAGEFIQPIRTISKALSARLVTSSDVRYFIRDVNLKKKQKATAHILLGDLKGVHLTRKRQFNVDIDLTTFPKMIIQVAKKLYGCHDDEEYNLCYITEGEERYLPTWESLLSAVCRAEAHGINNIEGKNEFVLRHKTNVHKSKVATWEVPLKKKKDVGTRSSWLTTIGGRETMRRESILITCDMETLGQKTDTNKSILQFPSTSPKMESNYTIWGSFHKDLTKRNSEKKCASWVNPVAEDKRQGIRKFFVSTFKRKTLVTKDRIARKLGVGKKMAYSDVGNQYLRFGLPLSRSSADGKSIPETVLLCSQFIETYGRDGVYRSFGSAKAVLAMKDSFCKGIVPEFAANVDSIDVASLLKLYLRELPGHLLGSQSMITSLMDLASHVADEKERVRWLHHCISSLPLVNRKILEHLFRHMRVIISQNTLGMSPLLFAQSFSTALDIPNMVIVDMIENYSQIFGTFEIMEDESQTEESDDDILQYHCELAM
eukprot:CFRG2027T1